MKLKFDILNRMRLLFPGKKKKRQPESKRMHTDNRDVSQREADVKKTPLVADLEKNLQRIASICGNSYDLNILRFLAGPDEVDAALVFLDGMVNKDAINNLMRIVKIDTFKTGIKGVQKGELYQTLQKRLLTDENREAENMEDLYGGVSLGEAALLINGTARAILYESKGWKSRALAEPESEISIRGPREGFTENIRENTSLIRRRIRSPNLWMESMKVGSLTKTEVVFAYIKGLAGEEVLGELRSRLERIDIDGVLESGVIEEFIRDAPYSLFPTIFRTERPDRVAANILEGRVAVFTSGTPFVLVLPADFFMFLQAPDDYNEVWPIGSFIRFLRIFSYVISIFLPGIYVSVLNFHPELLPTSLLLTIQQTREGVPFPVVAEVILMEAAFEILREAGIRLPRVIGPAISIVGALILGEASIRAGIVSPGVVIIVAFTAIASFSTPTFSQAIAARILRFGIIFLGAFIGLLGIQFAFLVLIIHLVSLRSFGYPLMAPLGPLIWRDLKDALFRSFWWKQVYRPRLLGFHEPGRQPAGQGPHTPAEKKQSMQNRGKGK